MSGAVDWYYAVNGTQAGPVDADTMRRKHEAGEIADDTFCWQPSFGADWRAFRDTELAAASPYAATPAAALHPTPMPNQPSPQATSPGAPSPGLAQAGVRLNNTYAWLFAISPLPTFLLSEVLGGSNAISTALSIGVYAGLRAADRLEILKSGFTKVPSAAWILLAPGYLWRRSTLLGQPRTPFWVMIGTIVVVVGVALGTSPDIRALLPGSTVLLSCSGAKDDTLKIFNTIDAVKRAGVEGVSIGEVAETALTDEKRSCHGVIAARDAKQYPVDFEITKQGSNNYIRVMVR